MRGTQLQNALILGRFTEMKEALECASEYESAKSVSYQQRTIYPIGAISERQDYRSNLIIALVDQEIHRQILNYKSRSVLLYYFVGRSHFKWDCRNFVKIQSKTSKNDDQ